MREFQKPAWQLSLAPRGDLQHFLTTGATGRSQDQGISGYGWLLRGPAPAVLILLQPGLPHSSLSGSHASGSQQGELTWMGWSTPGCVCRPKGSGQAQA